KDDNGDRMLKIMKENKLPADGVIRVDDRPTTTKTRIISSNQHIVRIDEEIDKPITKIATDKLFIQVEKLVEGGKIGVIIFEDYDKGVISATLIDKITALAKKHKVPTVVDPKKRNFLAYRHVTVFKPNLKELREGLNLDLTAKDMEAMRRAVEVMRKKQEIDIALITLSEYGVYVNSDTEKKLIPAHIRNISDVSGAGDTVVSIAALCCAVDVSPENMAFLSNLAGGQVCEKSGVVPVNKEQLLEEAKQYL
ncbi:MAG TPA: PfkB family carbohydrate kinase, partial [Bacteroidia bacterium]|nr:PfkB family carbohydrate kinase [Bacteroidia bacterium]